MNIGRPPPPIFNKLYIITHSSFTLVWDFYFLPQTMQHPFGSETSRHLPSADVTSILLSVFRDLKIATTVTMLKFSCGKLGNRI